MQKYFLLWKEHENDRDWLLIIVFKKNEDFFFTYASVAATTFNLYLTSVSLWFLR